MKHTGHVYLNLIACLALLSAIPAAAGAVFGPPQSYPAQFGGATQSVAGDFNGDGFPDIAIVNPCSSSSCGSGYSSVAVLIANGDGSFQSPVPYATGTYQSMSVAAADLNGDGVLDLVVASQCADSGSCGTGQVSVFLGNGDGTFQPPVSYPAGAGASYFVALGDFNRDGYLDVAVANQTSGVSTASILLGNGDGTLQAPVAYSTGAGSAQFIAIGDFNNDGALDLAVANGGAEDSVSILLGDGNGTFQAAVTYASGGAIANAIAVGDFNGDGVPDLAVVNACASNNNLTCATSGAVGVLLGNGDGTFQPPVSYATGGSQANSVSVADFDGDGRLDLAVANSGSTSGGNAGVLSLLTGNGDGTFQPAVTLGTGGYFASSVTVSDFNADGQPDLTVVNQCPSADSCNVAVAGVLLNITPAFQLYATSTTLSSSANPAAPGQAVLLTATVTPGSNAGAVTGNVTFYDSGTALSTVTVSNGQASYTASFPAAGPHAIQAIYSGGPNYAGSASTGLPEIVGTPVALTSSLNPSAVSQAVTFTATVGGPGGAATGTLTFADGSNSLGTFPLVNGSAAVTKSSLVPGTHTITATYSGDANFQPGAATLIQSVSLTTTIALASGSNPASTNQPITFTATVNGQTGGVPSGVVAFMQGAPPTTWGTAPLVNGQATILNIFPKQGTYPITAMYLGSPTYKTSTAATVNQVVSGSQNVTTTTTLASSGTPSYINQPVTFTAAVIPNSGAIVDGETVTFYNGANTIGAGATLNGVAVFTTSALPVGTNSITATYAGDSIYQSSTSHVVKQVVQLNATTTTLNSSLNPSVWGQSVTFTVTVMPQTGSGTPTGTVTLKNDGFTFGSFPLTNGSGSYTTPTLAIGSLQIMATYSGDNNFASSSATVLQAVNVASTTTTLTSTPNPASLNQAITFTATVTGQYGGNTSGTVTFTQGSNVLGSNTLVLGKANITASFSTTGTFPVVATYSGDTNDSGSTSPPLNQVVGSTSTTTSLTSSGTPSYFGQAVTFTATVTPKAGTIPDHESVTFYDGSASIGAGTTLNGVATFTTSALAVGTHSLTATYAGDANFQTSTSKPFRQLVNLNVSVTTLTPSANPIAYGQSLTITANVTAGSGTGVPTGKIAFKNGSLVIASVALTNGSAAYTTSTLTAGSLSLSASYSGDTNFAGSSATITEVVNLGPTATVLTSYPNPSSLNQSVSFTATVTAQYGGKLTGSVQFLNGSKLLGSAALSSGRANFTYTFTAAGTDPITAVYSGDTNNQTSTSAVLDQVVTNAVTTTAVSSSGTPAVVAQPVTFTASVTSAFGSIPDGELVTFYDGGAQIGTGSTRSGAASMTTSSLAVGTHNITATYAGDATFQTSTSAIFKQTINTQPTTTVVTSNANPSSYGVAVTFTATVTGSGPIPTGTVTFKNGATPLGTAALNSHGATTFTTLTLGTGSYPITASYSGDTSSAKSTSAALTQVVNQATTTMQLVSSVNPSSLGESVAFTATVRSATTFASGSVTFTAGSQLLGTASLVNGSAKLAVTTLPSGATNVTATFAATANIGGSSATITQYVD